MSVNPVDTVASAIVKFLKRHVRRDVRSDFRSDLSDMSSESIPLLESGTTSTPKPAEKRQKGSGWLASAFLIVNAALGCGFFNFPMAFHQAGGLVPSLTLQAVMLVFVMTSLYVLCYCSDVNACDTYQDMVHAVCGPVSSLVCSTLLCMYCFGNSVTSLIIVGDLWEMFFAGVAQSLYCGSNPFYMSRTFTILMSAILLILPLCFYKRIHDLEYASMFGMLGILYLFVLAIVNYGLPHPPPSSITTKPDSWVDVFLVVPTVCFAYACHVEIISVYAGMEKRKLSEVAKTINSSMFIVFLVYTTIGVLGYLQFGDKVNENILLSFKPHISIDVAVLLTAVKICTTYPIFLFIGREGIISVWNTARGTTQGEVQEKDTTRRVLTSLVWFATSIIFAVLVPNIGIIIRTQGTCAVLFIFILPGMCLLKTVHKRRASGKPAGATFHLLGAAAVVLMVSGAFIFGLTLAQTVMNDILNPKPRQTLVACRGYHIKSV